MPEVDGGRPYISEDEALAEFRAALKASRARTT